MKKVVLLSLVVLASCKSSSTEVVSSDSTSVKMDSVKAVVDSVKTDTLKK